MRYCISLVTLGWLLISIAGSAGQPPADESAKSTQDATVSAKDQPNEKQTKAGKPGPAATEFERLFGQWKTLLGEMTVLQLEHSRAGKQEQARIQKKWDRYNRQGRKLKARLTTAARAAFAEAPNTDDEIANFLMATIIVDSAKAKYEEMLSQSEWIIEAGANSREIYDWAGAAAFLVSEFAKAEKYVDLESKFGELSDSAKEIVSRLPECKKAWAKEQELRQAEAAADDLPRVLLKTSQGDIEVELFENEAPNTVANFISLVKKEFYDGLIFHRVKDLAAGSRSGPRRLPAYIAQTGCPLGDGSGGPGYTIPCECHQENYRQHFRGSLSMAHAGRDTAGSQFFISFAPTEHLDGNHTVFGRVIKGIDVLAKLARHDAERPDVVQPAADKIIKARVVRDRGHAYIPKKVGEESQEADADAADANHETDTQQPEQAE